MNYRMHYFLLLLCSLLATSLLQIVAQPLDNQSFYRVTSQSSSGLTLVFEFDEPEMQPIVGLDQAWSVQFTGLKQNHNSGDPLLPVVGLPLALPEGRSRISVAIQEVKDFPGHYPLLFVDESASAVESSTKITPERFTSLFPLEFCQLHDLGIMRDNRLGSLQIYPIQVTASGMKFYKRFEVRIQFERAQTGSASLSATESRMFSDLVVNSSQLGYSVVETPQQNYKTSAPRFMNSQVGSRYRLIVDEDGLYRVTGEDLEDAGVRLSDINTATMRLSSRDQDVAFYLFGDQDGTFDEVDFFEFWGERNEKNFLESYPDQYSDPFSDENVYWLEWGVSPGNRMVEENGSLTAIVPGEYNPAFNYRHTIHNEKNNFFERFGKSHQETLSLTRDNWFFDSGIKAVGKRAYPFQLEHPDNSSFNNVVVEAMLAGKSFGAVFDDGNPSTDDRVPHNVQLWLNNGYVGNGPNNWFGQDTTRVSNASSSTLRNSDLIHGTNVLEVQLPELPDITILVNGQSVPSKGTDIVLLNWFQITYDRLYRAENNIVEFTRPSFIPFPNTDIFRFKIESFRRPDVEIYKKGISRIVNFKIDERITGEIKEYDITFQDEVVTDDIEYVALTPEMKKKPLRIELDRPYDEESPNLTLRDAANAAEYVILTNNRFRSAAQELLDYRRSQGIVGKIVAVQDVYDEFNSGIKSPLAIREFLRYAFFNWQRSPRLKYVVLLGDATFDYKTKDELEGDFVPTYFYQTDLFGASASDYPYALIAGDDELPDLAIGRIPANTNSDIQGFVSKLIEYDLADVTTPWQSQALYISGNDRATYELENRFGQQFPAFRTQNSRVISTLMPKHLSGARLNTIRDETLPPNQFDPNFGTRTNLVDRWNDGLMFINFMGHGGGGIWADVNLMDIPDVELLNNKGRYPFVTSMTCFTGSYENPSTDGLAEKLVLTPDKGAIAVLASSGLGYLHNDYTMLWFIGQFLFSGSRTLGESMLLGKTQYWNNGGYNVNGRVYGTPGYSAVRREMVYQYNFIGDPLTRFRWTPKDLSVQISNATPQRGEAVDVTVNSSFFGAEGFIELVDRDFNIVDRQPVFGAGQTVTLNMTIPNDFPEGTGLFRVYLADGTVSAGGSVSIGVNYGVINDLTISPEAPRVDDSVKVRINAVDVNGLNRVYVITENNVDSLFAVPDPLEPDVYVATLPPTFRLKTVFFNVYLENNTGNVSIFSNQSYIVTDQRADVFFANQSLSFFGDRRAKLRVGLENSAGAGADNQIVVNVQAYDGIQNYTNNVSFANVSTVLSSLDSTSVSLDFTLPLDRPAYDLLLKATVSENEDVIDFNANNDTLRQTIAPLVYNVSPSAGLDTIALRSRFRTSFAPSGISDSSAVRIAVREIDVPANQTGLMPISLLQQGEFNALDVELLNPDAQLTIPYTIEITLNEALIDTNEFNLQDVRLYEKRNGSAPWTFVNSLFDATTRRVTAQSSRSSSFAIFFSDDQQPPTIELTADGRPLRERGLVGSTPSLYLVLQDASGIDTQKDRIEILLDEQPFPEDKLFIPDSVARNDIVGFTLFPELNRGTHDLSIRVQDVNGISSESTFKLQVQENFDVKVYGNYPNPFVDKTIFSYFVELNDDLDKFEIRIYTISGRRIKTISSDENNPLDALDGGARRKGYNELVWDGTDDDLQEVAYGVYFAVVRATYEGETIEKTLKVAKVQVENPGN